MTKEAAITVRVPVELKLRLEAKAAREHRSLSGQVVHELAAALNKERPPPRSERASVVGLFEGLKVPIEEEFREARELLWGRLGRCDA